MFFILKMPKRKKALILNVSESPPEPTSSQKEVKMSKQTDIRSFLKRK